MAVFIYHADQNGKMIKGEIQAGSLHSARIKLKTRRLDPIFIKEKPLIPFLAGGGRVKAKTTLFFTRQMSFLLGSGVSLIQALEMCIDMNEDELFKQVLKDVLKQLEGGKSFSRALQSRPDIFDGFYINMVVCAEETGLLDQVLKDLADYMERSQLIKSRVRSAMMYPAIVLSISFCIITGIIIFVVPKFEALYTGSGGELPALTQTFVNLSHWIRGNLWVTLGSMVIIPAFVVSYSKTDSGKKLLQSVITLLPLFGKIQYQAGMVRFFHSFHSLLKSGVNFLEALDVSRNIAGHDDLSRGILTARNHITKGKSFAKGLETSRAFPPLVHHMAAVGEESGKLDQSFARLAVYYEERLNHLINGLIKMIEPLLIVILGGLIGLIILSLYLPVFKMGDIVS